MFRRTRKGLLIGASVLLLLALVSAVAAHFAAEPLQRALLARLNEKIQGYRVDIGSVDPHPLSFSVDLRQVALTQDAHPDPPVASIPVISASLSWRDLLRGRIAGQVMVKDPVLYLSRANVESEKKDPTPVGKHGWQDAVQSILPVKVNTFAVENAHVTYIEKPKDKPVEITGLNIKAHNIQNVVSEHDDYPSEVQVDAAGVGEAQVAFTGRADFMAKPFPAIQGELNVRKLDIVRFTPVLQAYGITLRGGMVASARTALEYAPGAKWVRVAQAELRDLDGDYLMVDKGQKQAVKQTAKAAATKKQEDELEVRVDHLQVVNGTIGFHNRTTQPDYRVFVSGLRLDVQNYSNGFQKGQGVMRLQGRFMGKGRMATRATFRPEKEGPDFNLDVAIEDTPMTDLNPLFKAYGKLDVASGNFSFYSEMAVKNGRMQGYVKPLFQQVEVYSSEQDKDKDMLQKIYEGLAGAVSKILENRRRDEVATRTEVSGPLRNPKADTWEAVTFLVRNAFVQSILPGFEQAYTPNRSGKKS
jgi:uncharacterized protein involved in outer membrane biogenesis